MSFETISNSVRNFGANVLSGAQNLATSGYAALPTKDAVVSAVSQVIFSKITHLVLLGTATVLAGRATVQAYTTYVKANTIGEVLAQDEVIGREAILAKDAVIGGFDAEGNIIPAEDAVEGQDEIQGQAAVEYRAGLYTGNRKNLAKAIWMPALATVALLTTTIARAII
jgi:hypothetical protein